MSSEKFDVVEMIEALCRIDSRSVLGASGSTEVGTLLAERLAALGFECERVECPAPEPRGEHLIARRNPGGPNHVIFCGHSDTVLGPDEVPFHADPATGRIFGAGVADMKGGLVMIVEAIRLALTESQAVRESALTVVINASEESATKGFGPLLRSISEGGRAFLNFEPAILNADGSHLLPNCRKGIVRCRLEVKGVSAHAGNNHRSGANALRELARKIEFVESLTDYPRELTANVGVAAGGKAFNQVPDHAWMEFELRAMDAGIMEEAVRRIEEEVSKPAIRSADGGAVCSMTLQRTPGFPPWPESPGTNALLERYSALAAKEGFKVVTGPRGGAADVGYIGDLLPSMDGLGIIGGLLHNPGEWADVRALDQRIRATAGLVREICEEGAG